MEKLKPHYDLSAIQLGFASASSLNRTMTALEGADDLGMDDAAVIAVIQNLTRSDFEKSMTSYADATIWQDVYRPSVNGIGLYVKFTLDDQKNYLLISFKEA